MTASYLETNNRIAAGMAEKIADRTPEGLDFRVVVTRMTYEITIEFEDSMVTLNYNADTYSPTEAALMAARRIVAMLHPR